MGAVFGSKNLRALVVKSTNKVEFDNPSGMKALAKLASQRMEGSGFPEILKKYGTPGVVGPQAEGGNLATHNFSRSWHEDYNNLHGATYEDTLSAGSTTCFGCVVGCREKVKADSPWKVTDRLGGLNLKPWGFWAPTLTSQTPSPCPRPMSFAITTGWTPLPWGGGGGILSV